MKQIDNEMTNLLKSSFNEKIVLILQKQWTKQGSLSPNNSFQKKNNGLKKNWMSVSKPKDAADRDPNKQENDIQYQTYYRN